MIELSDVVKAYVDCGNAVGYFNAEMILMRHLPKNKPGGKCSDVAVKKRKEFLDELKNTVQGNIAERAATAA